MKNHRLVVVGAGIAGLTAAHRLKREGYDPIVFERADKVGGRMATDVVEDFTIDYGAQFLYDNFSLLPNLIREVDLAPKLVQGGQTLSMLKGGQCRAFRADDLLSPLKSGILGLGAWLRFGVLGYGRLATQTRSLPGNDITAWTRFDDLSMAMLGAVLLRSRRCRLRYRAPEQRLLFSTPSRDVESGPAGHLVSDVQARQVFDARRRYRRPAAPVGGGFGCAARFSRSIAFDRGERNRSRNGPRNRYRGSGPLGGDGLGFSRALPRTFMSERELLGTS